MCIIPIGWAKGRYGPTTRRTDRRGGAPRPLRHQPFRSWRADDRAIELNWPSS
ncbi:MAG: hypothetical protein R2699_12165 [Acidimicrobiales bacterium]